ncbi:unnamed protein product [Moneuplotes crassus]|uniref:Uncharacterized protein n=1 Tax=Euplotes crassus TaxID=5936 RepID=A0AAD1UJ61_EUPCR|nr:unnamed protein product [Moneuplotes crassus]
MKKKSEHQRKLSIKQKENTLSKLIKFLEKGCYHHRVSVDDLDRSQFINIMKSMRPSDFGFEDQEGTLKMSYVQATEAFLDFKGEKMEKHKRGNIKKLALWIYNKLKDDFFRFKNRKRDSISNTARNEDSHSSILKLIKTDNVTLNDSSSKKFEFKTVHSTRNSPQRYTLRSSLKNSSIPENLPSVKTGRFGNKRLSVNGIKSTRNKDFKQVGLLSNRDSNPAPEVLTIPSGQNKGLINARLRLHRRRMFEMGEEKRRIEKISKGAQLNITSASVTMHLEHLLKEKWEDNPKNYRLKVKINKKERKRLGNLLNQQRLSSL